MGDDDSEIFTEVLVGVPWVVVVDDSVVDVKESNCENVLVSKNDLVECSVSNSSEDVEKTTESGGSQVELLDFLGISAGSHLITSLNVQVVES